MFEDYSVMYGLPKEKCVTIRRRLIGTARQHAINLGKVEYGVLRCV